VIKAEGDIALLLVELEDGKIILGENVESELIFVSGFVEFVMGEFPLSEEVFDNLLLDGGGAERAYEEDREDDEDFHYK